MITTFLKIKSKLFFFLGAVCVLFFFLVLSKNFGQNLSPLPKLDLSYKRIELPAKEIYLKTEEGLPPEVFVYQIQDSWDFDKVRSIAKNFKLSGQPQASSQLGGNPVFIWEDSEVYLSIDPLLGFIFYLRKSEDIGPPSQIFVSQDFREAAVKFLKEKGLYSKDLIFEDHVEYLSPFAQEAVPGESQEMSSLAQVSFRRTKDSLPVVDLDPEASLVRVWLDRTLQVVKLESRGQFFGEERRFNYPLKHMDSLKQYLIKGGGFPALFTIFETQADVYSEKIERVEFYEVSLSYLLTNHPQRDFVQPIYILKGNVQIQGGRTGELVIYIQAVKERYIQGFGLIDHLENLFRL